MPHSHIHQRYSYRSKGCCLGILLLIVITLLAPIPIHAVDLDWTRKGEEPTYGELAYFDFERKILTIKVSDTDKEIKFPSSELDDRSKWIALFSPTFLQSIPSDNFQEEHLHLAFIFIALPAILYLFSFWLCAILITQKVNPLRALIALPGAWIFSGFLLIFYVFMIGRYPEKTLLICSLGSIITLVVAALFVSIIYNKNVIYGMLILIFHAILAPLIFTAGIYMTYRFGEPEKVETFFENRVFIATGLLPEKENEA